MVRSLSACKSAARLSSTDSIFATIETAKLAAQTSNESTRMKIGETPATACNALKISALPFVANSATAAQSHPTADTHINCAIRRILRTFSRQNERFAAIFPHTAK